MGSGGVPCTRHARHVTPKGVNHFPLYRGYKHDAPPEQRQVSQVSYNPLKQRQVYFFRLVLLFVDFAFRAAAGGFAVDGAPSLSKVW